jgi:hypothetical protein
MQDESAVARAVKFYGTLLRVPRALPMFTAHRWAGLPHPSRSALVWDTACSTWVDGAARPGRAWRNI